jgi:hypothetical protein
MSFPHFKVKKGIKCHQFHRILSYNFDNSIWENIKFKSEVIVKHSLSPWELHGKMCYHIWTTIGIEKKNIVCVNLLKVWSKPKHISENKYKFNFSIWWVVPNVIEELENRIYIEDKSIWIIKLKKNMTKSNNCQVGWIFFKGQ